MCMRESACVRMYVKVYVSERIREREKSVFVYMRVCVSMRASTDPPLSHPATHTQILSQTQDLEELRASLTLEQLQTFNVGIFIFELYLRERHPVVFACVEDIKHHMEIPEDRADLKKSWGRRLIKKYVRTDAASVLPLAYVVRRGLQIAESGDENVVQRLRDVLHVHVFVGAFNAFLTSHYLNQLAAMRAYSQRPQSMDNFSVLKVCVCVYMCV
jgi:hypothetical protein